MGTFTVTVGVGHIDGGDLTPVEATVDTGAEHSMFPESLLRHLHLEPWERRYWTLADGNDVAYGCGVARLAIDDRQWHCTVIFGPEDMYLLGATTLENFNLMVDPIEGKLVPKTLRARPI